MLLFAGSAALAQESGKSTEVEFSAERPGFTNGTETVPHGHFQLETGYTYSKQGDARTHLLDDGAQIRLPLTAHSEVRLGLPNYALLTVAGQKSSGWNSALLSGKIRFLDETKNLPAIALIAGTTLPTGSKDTSEHYFQPSLDLEVSRQLTERYTLQASYVYTSARDNGERFDAFAGGLNLGMQVTSEISAFAEVYRVAPTGADGAVNADYFDAGTTWTLRNRMQLDVSGGVGLTKDVHHDYFLGAGIARRW